jgi:hypothetical protein
MTTLNGPSGDNGFDQKPKKTSVYGACAHFSSMDHRIIKVSAFVKKHR